MESSADIYNKEMYNYEGIETFLEELNVGEVNEFNMYQDDIDDLINDITKRVSKLELYHKTAISGYHSYENGIKDGEKSVHINEVKFKLINDTTVDIDIVPKYS